MIIHPEVIVAPDLPTIKFSQPRDQVNLNIELPRILQTQGWGCGTYFHVQFLNHEKTELLACALFVVTKEVEGIHTSDNQYYPMTKTVYSREAKRVGDWWTAGLETLEGKPVRVVNDGAASVTWNPGRKMHQVKIDGKIVYETHDKEEANKIASGEIPIPGVAA